MPQLFFSPWKPPFRVKTRYVFSAENTMQSAIFVRSQVAYMEHERITTKNRQQHHLIIVFERRQRRIISVKSSQQDTTCYDPAVKVN